MGIIPITSDNIKRLNKIAIQHSGGQLGILNDSTIKNCSDLITNKFFGAEQHIGLFRKAAALMECISVGHGFLDGNKRTALLAVEEFLFKNGWVFSPDGKTTKISIKTAKGETNLEELQTWIESCSRPKF